MVLSHNVTEVMADIFVHIVMYTPKWNINEKEKYSCWIYLSTVYKMEADLNVSLQSIVRKRRGKRLSNGIGNFSLCYTCYMYLLY